MSTASWQGRTAVITGAASGFGLETSRLAARNPSDPYRERPELGEQLRAALRR